jgi:histidinol phosphatase-like enzyme (inositol monophosphatase family)
MSIISLERFFADLAAVSGEAILPFFRMRMTVADKTGGKAFDPVTEADRAAELAIRQRIQKQFPDHGIIGEEFGVTNPDAEHAWIIDPIDGTRAFICGMPTWGTLVGLTKGGNPVYGMMNQPHVGERFVGDGAAARLIGRAGERKLSVRACEDLSSAYIATTSPRLFKGDEAAAYDRVEIRCKLARYGTDCYAYALLAAGQIDLVIESGLQAYDIAPLVPIIEGAGGIVTTWEGGAATGGGRIVAAGDRRLHAQSLELLNG